MNAINPAMIEPDPIEIDPRPCGLCGFKIDRHEMVDDGEGPIFYCPEFDVGDDVADIVRRLELADPRDRWKHTGEAPPKASDVSTARPEPYRTPQATIDAFLYIVRLGDADYLSRWLAQHPVDAACLLKIWERKNALA